MTKDAFTFDKYTPAQQGSGAFDGGKITEIKPIPFPQESGGAKRTGPLLYWAWATASGDGIIGMHPHQGFEIVSYVFQGSIGHTDTAGNNRRVHAGGLQVMQTGSGISHREEMYGERTDFFQVWFEPNLSEAITRPPVYQDGEDKDIPVEQLDEMTSLKRLIGPNAPVQLEAPVKWVELSMDHGGQHTLELEDNSLAAMVVLSGSAKATVASHTETLEHQDFALIKTSSANTLTLAADNDATRIALITSPIDPGYPLMRF